MSVPASCVVLCKSVGVLLAEVHVGGAAARRRGLAVEAAASPAGADRGSPSGEGPTWLLVRGPVLSVPGGRWVGCPGGCGCCSPEWGKNPVETCGPGACWVGWVPTGDLSGTRIVAAGPTGRSVRGWGLRAVVGAGSLLEYWKVEADERLLSDGRTTVEHRCLAVAPVALLPVWGTEGLQGDRGLADGVLHLVLSSWLHSAASSTQAVRGTGSWPE